MFNKYFDRLYEKVYFYSYLITFVSLFFPWIRSLDIYILGITLLFGIFILALLSISSVLFIRSKRHKKILGISNIIIGILCLLSTFGHLIGYGMVIELSGGFIGFSFGVYVGMFGSLGIIVSGILGLKFKNGK